MDRRTFDVAAMVVHPCRMTDVAEKVDAFIAEWAPTGGSELANTQSFVNGLCALIGVDPPRGSRSDDAHNDYVFERRVFQKEADGSESFGRIDAYKRDSFVLEAKQGSEADRAAAEKGEADLDIFGQTAAVRVKRGTARRGTPAWSKAMDSARGQAERYAKAVPVDHGWPPFLLVTDVGYCIDIYADFSGTGKQYTQFPDAARFRIMLDDLRDSDVRDRLARIWTEPHSLDASKEAAKVTREIADKLAELSKRLEARGHNPTRVADFLMRCLFTMFAEDVRLIPEGSFKALLERMQSQPENLTPALTGLWKAMDKGGWSGDLGAPVLKFNGYLFKDQTVIPLEAGEIGLLREAAEKKWDKVEPAIFGTLLERALDTKERAKLGAHYTPRAYVERLVMPTVIEPLRADWDGVRAAAGQLIEAGKADEARKTVEAFHGTLTRTKVLDPACGTGNFLYVAMARMKELEGEVVALLTELGDVQYVAELSGHTITPENFLGIEINPRAAAIAQLVLWIGYLQWHFRVNGADKMPNEPILRDVRTIENRDALITWDSKILERGPDGRPITRWDGETMKPHPVTGKKVPDEMARVEVWRYVNPKAAKWPKVDFIIGNPPFIGKVGLRSVVGDGYFEAIFKVSDVPESADFVMHWWDRAATLVRKGRVQKFGLITTNSLSQKFSRRVVERHFRALDPIGLTFVIADHPWIDEKGSADVRIAITVAERGPLIGRLARALEDGQLSSADRFGLIGPDLRLGADVSSAFELKANDNLGANGCALHGDGFILTPAQATAFTKANPANQDLIRPYRNGRDMMSRPRGVYVIDAFGVDEETLRAQYPDIYQYLLTTVKPHRDANRRDSIRKYWWIFGWPRPELRKATASLKRYLVTVETTKHRIFQYIDKSVVPDHMLVCFALDDAIYLGVLTSRIHLQWTYANCGLLGVAAFEQGHRYTKTRCFDTFPFPADISNPLRNKIRAEAEALDALRKRVLAEHDDLTLTGLYNVLEALRAGRALTDKERDVHDRGLVTLIRQHHDAIDALVAEAYGWGAEQAAGTLTDALILERLVALNKERAAEEAKGFVRWLRPDFQAPGAAKAPVLADLDLGEAPSAAPGATIIPWPKTLPEQVSAVAAVLASAPAPMTPREVASAFKGKQARSVEPVLGALAAIGRARRLASGRYAA